MKKVKCFPCLNEVGEREDMGNHEEAEHREPEELVEHAKVVPAQCTMYLTLNSFSLKLCRATIDLET